MSAMAGLLVLGLFGAAPLHAEEPLSAEALRTCAAQVQDLRERAPRLYAEVQGADARRAEINAQSAALQREADGLAREDLNAHLDLQQRRKAHNEVAAAFNQQMVEQRQAIEALNRVKAAYERNCADRSYRRSDFAKLTPEAQAAMRAGLHDIVVPYVEPAR